MKLLIVATIAVLLCLTVGQTLTGLPDDIPFLDLEFKGQITAQSGEGAVTNLITGALESTSVDGKSYTHSFIYIYPRNETNPDDAIISESLSFTNEDFDVVSYAISQGQCVRNELKAGADGFPTCTPWTKDDLTYTQTCVISLLDGEELTSVSGIIVDADTNPVSLSTKIVMGDNLLTEVSMIVTANSPDAPAPDDFQVPDICVTVPGGLGNKRSAEATFFNLFPLLSVQSEKRGLIKKIGKGIKKAVGGSKCSICKTAVSVIKAQYGGKISAIPAIINRACGNIPIASALCKTFIGGKAAKIGELLNSGDSVNQVCKLIKAC